MSIVMEEEIKRWTARLRAPVTRNCEPVRELALFGCYISGA